MENFPDGHYRFMEDNGPKHTSHVAKDVHADKGWSRVVKLVANTCKQLSVYGGSWSILFLESSNQ